MAALALMLADIDLALGQSVNCSCSLFYFAWLGLSQDSDLCSNPLVLMADYLILASGGIVPCTQSGLISQLWSLGRTLLKPLN